MIYPIYVSEAISIKEVNEYVTCSLTSFIESFFYRTIIATLRF